MKPYTDWVRTQFNNTPDGPFKDIHKIAREAYRNLMAQREEILKAFIAKYGCEPDEVIQVEQSRLDGTRTLVVMNKKDYKPPQLY